MNSTTKAFGSTSEMLFVWNKRDPNLDFDILFFPIEWNLPELCELKTKMHLTMKQEDLLHFTFLCIKQSVPFIDKSFIYWLNQISLLINDNL